MRGRLFHLFMGPQAFLLLFYRDSHINTYSPSDEGTIQHDEGES